jgi:cyclohexadienyl dehydratase
VKYVLAAAALAALPAMAAAQTPAPDTLGHVMQTHTLRVCSPGDYKPFSFMEKDGHFEGLDVDMMNSLAATLDAKATFVKTTWKNLMDDFTSGKCDIGAGGISVSLPRQQKAFFSAPYMINGKTPLTLCKNAQKYQTIAEIDNPDVRVIFNPGGSNEKFAREHLAKAHLIPYKNNLGIFQEVADGKADVFVTEAAEAEVQSHLNPKLCAVNPDKPLQYAEMGYLLPEGDMRFKLYVDQWLHLSKASGAYDTLAGKWLPKK